ncbi:hypothetical protein ACHAXA_009399 [Cyclostephanos tholiformis]|uniref:OTU domain-containing protein n=1 Tax=Cyclostephanos tholiformis TaxID=382380 RepID=A0ABD3R9K8_9STRA
MPYSPLVQFVVLASTLRPQSTASFSIPAPTPQPSRTSPVPANPPSPHSPPSKCDFRSFEFDPTTGICRRPSTFRYDDDVDDNGGTQYFVVRNVPGNGDCLFHAVLGSVFVSMGMINPDSAYSDAVHSMVLEMRQVVANFLSSPEGTLYVNNRPRKRIVRCRDLLSSAAMAEGMSSEEYLARLRLPGRDGGLYGGGPELTVLSNILRRPISIFHLKQRRRHQSSIAGGGGGQLSRITTDGVVSNAVFFTLDGRQQGPGQSSSPPISSPLKCSWHLNILIVDAGDGQKHACVLLPSVSILHNVRQPSY